jgi:hypothetical protein
VGRFTWVMTGAGLAAVACAAGRPAVELPDPPVAFPHAMAVRSCAPWDGPATDIYLTPDPVDSAALGPAAPPYVSIGIWRGPAALPGTTIVWPGADQVGAASRCADGDACEAVSKGRVSFHPSPAVGELSGTLDLEFASGLRIAGGFRARVRPNPALCG